MIFRGAFIGIGAVAIGVASVMALPAANATPTPLVVTSTADSGAGSLRQALADAVDGQTISFGPSVTGAIDLLTPLTVATGVTITGPGAKVLSIDGGNKVQDLVIGSGSTTVTVTGLTLTHGSGPTGGAIQDDAGQSLVLVHDVVSNSSASTSGGGIYLNGPQHLSISGSLIAGNTAPVGGGIDANIQAGGSMVIDSSTISANTATTGEGAGIYGAGQLTSSSSAASTGAVCSGCGAEGSHARTPPTPPPTSVGVVDLTISTIANNTATGANAAVYLHQLDSLSTLSSDTIAENHATGLALDSPVSKPSLAATLLADNSADCAGATFLDRGYNISSDASCVFGATGSVSHATTLDAALGPLHLNGGPTSTIAISGTGDPAHAVVPSTFTVPDSTPTLCTVADQRGVLPAGSPCDIGAFQREAAPKIKAIVTSRSAKTHFGWYRTPVRVSFTCHSASSLISVACPAEVVLHHSGRNQHATGTATALDGRTATVKVGGLDIDTVAPTVDGVADGHTYAKAPTITCHDALSGIDSCTIHRHQHGQRVSYSVTALDKAGNSTEAKGHYTLS